MITRRAFASSLAPAFLARAQGRRRPNLLFLIADDHAGYVMGCDGNAQALTPNLDALAAQGTRFAAHYCNSPVCTPSRQSLLTGQMPHMAGVTQLRTALDPAKPNFAKQLKAAGYQTAVFGKMHFNRPASPGLHGFETIMTEGEITKAWQKEVKPAPVPPGVRTKPLPWRPFATPAREWLNGGNLPYPRKDEDMRGTYIARQSIRYLEEAAAGSRPFALWCSLQEPHSPFDFPVEDRSLIDPKKMAVPRVGPEDAWQIPLIFRGLTPEEKQGIIAAYYTSAAFMDRNFGRVLNKLRELRLDENTLIVYTADHGYCLGQHGRFEKHCGYDAALRVPLIMSLPGRIRAGVVKDLTEHLDLAPTILELLDAPALAMQHGQSLAPYLAGKRPAKPRSHIVSEYLENEEVFVRTNRWKLIHSTGKRERLDGYKTDNPTPGRYTKLYDLEKDPGEFTDVSGANPKVVAELQQVALDRFRATHPERDHEPSRSGAVAALEFYLPPRDNAPPAEARP
ncbi:MAG: sulfatase-like hydrolase/transferase [Bryobacteraceae bacterium]|nr:sulfatase-like hydrolase/transferase [Bryobacteraceae bacterium]